MSYTCYKKPKKCIPTFIQMNITKEQIAKIKPNPKNPRVIKDDKFHKMVKSIQDFPEMLNIRPIVVNKEMFVLGGNMRLKACKEAGLKEIPIIVADELTEDQQREFIIKDNVGYGEWEMQLLLQEWEQLDLEEWGVDLPGFDIDLGSFGEEFTLNNEERNPLGQMTFILSPEQQEVINQRLTEIKRTEEYKYVETFGNHNTNGNALYLLITQWAEQKKYK